MAETFGLQLNEQLNNTSSSSQLFFGPFQYFGRCKGCNNNLSSNSPASQYQRQKIIQNQVRVQSSLYSMNLAALNAYQKPNTLYETIKLGQIEYLASPGVNWNQMSDRRNPHIQPFANASGTNPGGNSVKRTITRQRPGAMSPGGVGVDIKHNSYERYLNRIKGKAPLRRGVIPPNYGRQFIPFNPAFPIYGGKVVKTSLVSGCNCLPIVSDIEKEKEIEKENNIQNDIYDVKYTFSVNDKVVIIDNGPYFAQVGTIIDIQKGIYLVQFSDKKVAPFTYSSFILLLPKCLPDPCFAKINVLVEVKEQEKKELAAALRLFDKLSGQ